MTDAPAPIETVHDTSLEGIEREPNIDLPYKAQVTDDYEVEIGVLK